MDQLYRITTGAETLAEYRTKAEMEDVPESEIESRRRRLDGATGDLEALGDTLDDIVSRYEQGEAQMEQEAAVAVHQHLDITRRHAAQPGLWHWLAIVQFPEYVRHRFGLDGAIEEKFVGIERQSDIYSNGLHRLWWFAELTRDGDDYSRTQKMLGEGNQFIVERFVDRSFSMYAPAMKAAVDVLIDEDGKTAEKVAKEFRTQETNYNLESMNQAEIEVVFENLLARV
jgi:hypothetical protein